MELADVIDIAPVASQLPDARHGGEESGDWETEANPSAIHNAEGGDQPEDFPALRKSKIPCRRCRWDAIGPVVLLDDAQVSYKQNDKALVLDLVRIHLEKKKVVGIEAKVS